MFRLFFTFLFVVPLLFAGPKVTFEQVQGARLGDLLVTYLHAEWISYHYGIPLVFHPFDSSELFAMHELETRLNPSEKIVPVHDLAVLNRLEDKIYEIYYTPECRGEHTSGPERWLGRPIINVDWEDANFIEWIRPYFTPTVSVNQLPLPTDKVTVAVHIRRPYGIDNDPHIDQIFPYKFLPDQFYIDQLRWLYEEMGRRPLHAYIFSNDPRAKKLVSVFQRALKDIDITFDYPKVLDETPLGVLADLCSMMHFDCLIRPDSNLSIVASRVGYQKIVISPEHVTVSMRGNVVDRVCIDRR